MKYIVYGIKNCNTVKKALDWLQTNQMDTQFHDYKKVGITTEKLQNWINQIGYELLINKKGTTWKQLLPAEQALIVDAESATTLMMQKNSVIKRPIIEDANGKIVVLGFDESSYVSAFK